MQKQEEGEKEKKLHYCAIRNTVAKIGLTHADSPFSSAIYKMQIPLLLKNKNKQKRPRNGVGDVGNVSIGGVGIYSHAFAHEHPQ